MIIIPSVHRSALGWPRLFLEFERSPSCDLVRPIDPRSASQSRISGEAHSYNRPSLLADHELTLTPNRPQDLERSSHVDDEMACKVKIRTINLIWSSETKASCRCGCWSKIGICPQILVTHKSFWAEVGYKWDYIYICDLKSYSWSIEWMA